MSQPRQGALKGILPKPTPAQQAALTYVLAEKEAKTVKDRAKKRKDEMVVAAMKEGKDTITVLDPDDNLTYTFEIQSTAKVKVSKYVKVETVKVEDD